MQSYALIMEEARASESGSCSSRSYAVEKLALASTFTLVVFEG